MGAVARLQWVWEKVGGEEEGGSCKQPQGPWERARRGETGALFRRPPRGGVAPGHGMLPSEAPVRATQRSQPLSSPWETRGCSSDAAWRTRAPLARVSPGRSWMPGAAAFGASTSNFRGAPPLPRGLGPASHEAGLRSFSQRRPVVQLRASARPRGSVGPLPGPPAASSSPASSSGRRQVAQPEGRDAVAGTQRRGGRAATPPRPGGTGHAALAPGLRAARGGLPGRR